MLLAFFWFLVKEQLENGVSANSQLRIRIQAGPWNIDDHRAVPAHERFLAVSAGGGFITPLHAAIRNIYSNYGTDQLMDGDRARMKSSIGILKELLLHGADPKASVPDYLVCNLGGK